MIVTHVSILEPEGAEAREGLLAFVTITLDNEFVVRDMKLIQRRDKTMFVDFPSVSAPVHCSTCSRKIGCISRYCPFCGEPRNSTLDTKFTQDGQRRASAFVNLAHPTKQYCREMIHNAVLTAWHRHKSRQQPTEGGWDVEERHQEQPS